MKIILIGFMGSGKTTTAHQLSQILNWPVIEMDEMVLKKIGAKNIQEVFDEKGELTWRETEIQVAKENSNAANHVISTGGGVVLNRIILDYLKNEGGRTYFLNTPFLNILKRIDISSRPLFRDVTNAESLYEFRHSLYVEYADKIIEVENKPLDEIVQEIIEDFEVNR